MNYVAWIAVVSIFISLCYIAFRLYKKKTKSEIPDDILLDFKEAERRYKENGGEIDRRKILWDIARKHFPAGIQDPSGELSIVETGEIIDERAGIQSGNTESAEQLINPEREDTKQNRPVRKHPRFTGI